MNNYLNVINKNNMTSNNMNCGYIIFTVILAIYMLSFTIYSGYTADNNKPGDDSSGLYIASYVICIIQCILYLIGFFYVIVLGLTYTPKDSNKSNNSNKTNDSNSCGIIPLGLNIYWIVVYFNYKISEKYDEFALVKTTEFFTLLGLVILGLCVMCFAGLCLNEQQVSISKPNNDKAKIVSTV